MNYWPRWIRAIRGKTLTLSMAQMGAYDRLLDYYYEEEQPLPSDMDECCRIAGAVSRQDRADVEKVLAKFFVLGAAGYSQERADDELAIGLKKIAAAQSNGKSGGRPKGSVKKPTGLPVGLDAGNPEATQGEPRTKAPHPQNTSSPSVKKERKRSNGFDAATIDLPDWLDRDLWCDWVADRKERGKPITERAAKQQMSALDEYRRAGHTAERTIRHAIASGNQGLYPPPRVLSAANGETPWQRSQRERAHELGGGLVTARAPGERSTTKEIVDVTAAALG